MRSASNNRSSKTGRRGIRSGLAVVGCAVTIAACGSPRPSHGSSLTGKSKLAGALAFAVCMRSHGLPNFPDPKVDGNSIQIPGSMPGINRQAPAFKSAQQSCRHVLPGGGQPTQAEQQQAKAQLLTVSQCMRADGISPFPDPTASRPSNRAGYSDITEHDGVFLAIPNSIDLQSPAFQHAAGACNFGPLASAAPKAK